MQDPGGATLLILDQDTRPENQIYHLGAILIGVLGEEMESIDLHLAYERLNSMVPVSSGAFLLILDWLFLLGAIVTDNGRIKRCF